MTNVPEALHAPVDRVLIADDDSTIRMTLARAVSKAEFDVISVSDGFAARDILVSSEPPQVLLLDWNMPGMTGPELARWVRSQPSLSCCYIALITARDSTEDFIEGLAAGADDFIRKPFNATEVAARVSAGRRLAMLQASLAARLRELESALAEVHQLRGLIPICAHCHSIRSSAETWQRLEGYLEQHSDATFSHSICDACMTKYYPLEESGEEEAA